MYINERRERERASMKTKYIKKGAIHMIIICTTLIRENTPGVFVENAFRSCYCLLVFTSFSHSTHTNDDDDDDTGKCSSQWWERKSENAQHVSSFPNNFLFACCVLKFLMILQKIVKLDKFLSPRENLILWGPLQAH